MTSGQLVIASSDHWPLITDNSLFGSGGEWQKFNRNEIFPHSGVPDQRRFSLVGLVAGLAIAAWNYGRVAALLLPYLKNEAVDDTIGFIVIALVVMGIAAVAGTLLHKTFHRMGLGCLDRLAGGVFGLIQGMLLVTLCILVALAFFPQAHWLAEARAPRLFFGVCHLSTHVTPAELENPDNEWISVSREKLLAIARQVNS